MIRRLALLLTAFTPLWAAAAITVADHRGGTLTLAEPPQRIITLMPSLTEGVCALGACARLVGTDRFSNAPPEVLALPKLGAKEEAQVERIVALKPDVVIVAPSARVTARLEQLGVKVLVIDSNTQAQVKQGLDTLAVLLGVPERSAAVWALIQRDIAKARDKFPAALRGQRVYFEVDGSSYAAGQTSFIGETLIALGMGNIVGPELGPFPKLNPEFVVRAQPDIIMASQRNVDSMPGRPGWATMKALRDRRVCGFSPERYEFLIRPGPRMGEAALILADCLAGLPAAARPAP